jgi:hypothetical protein
MKSKIIVSVALAAIMDRVKNIPSFIEEQLYPRHPGYNRSRGKSHPRLLPKGNTKKCRRIIRMQKLARRANRR